MEDDDDAWGSWKSPDADPTTEGALFQSSTFQRTANMPDDGAAVDRANLHKMAAEENERVGQEPDVLSGGRPTC